MKDKIREIILSCGADLCGFANVNRFENAPKGFNPIDVYHDCKSVISFAVTLPQGLVKANTRLIYGYFNYASCHEVDSIALKSAKKIEECFTCIAVPVPCDIPYEYWDEDQKEGRGLLSMKHAAVQAGLGSLGKNALFINKRYGNRVTLGAILTNIELPSDDMVKNVCIPGCNKCVEACPVKAIENGIVNQKRCRENAYGKTKRGFDTVECNKCRMICPISFIKDTL